MKKYETKLWDSMKNCSLDPANAVYMVDYDDKVVNFDFVCKKYCKINRLIQLSSADVLISDGICDYLIEFKNGKISDSETYSIKQKMYESIIIYSIVEDVSVKIIKDKLIFILVYNDSKNSSKEGITNHISKKANKRVVKFNLDRLRGAGYKEIITFTEKEFEEWYNSKKEELMLNSYVK